MSVSGGPNIVEDGLVFLFDAANPLSYVSGSSIISNIVNPVITGSLINSPSYSSGNLGGIRFNGTNQWIKISDTPYLNPNTESFSVVCWASGSGGVDGWVTKRASSTNGYYLGPVANNISWIVANNTDTRSDCGISYLSGSWGMYTGIINRLTTQSRLVANNNAQINTNTSPTGSHTNTANFGIGLDEAGTNWTFGSIAMVMVYNRALSAQEIEQNFNAQRSRFGV